MNRFEGPPFDPPPASRGFRLAGAALLAAALLGSAGAPAGPEEKAPAAPAAPGPVEPPAAAPGPGFLTSAEAQRRAESVFLATPSPDRLRATLRILTEEPHVAGTPAGLKAAEYVRDGMKALGFDSRLVPYEVLLNYPKSVSLRLTAPEIREFSLREAGDPRDKDSFSRDAFPAFHGYGASGSAAGQVVYANYGRREDFEKLEEIGVTVRGRIVIARYGEVFRGLKVREAQERGAAAVILYSDPADDGYAKGDVYPDGPWRPDSAIQRGSVHFLSLGPGDPQTPGRPSVKGAKRVPIGELTSIPKIPSLPISYGDAWQILHSLAGQNVPAGWQGGLPFAYHTGPGPAEVEMSVEMDYGVRTIWNVITTIPGRVEPDRWVIFGNHRDAWTYGAVDPNSGTAAQMEMARGLRAAMEQGWAPRRTLVLASWDGEEYGLLGSTEWVEDLAADLDLKAVAYVNVDSAVSGTDFSAAGVPSLRDLTVAAAASVRDPRTGRALLDLWRAREHRDWAEKEPLCPRCEPQEFALNLAPVGSGSDYTAFLDHLGIPVVDMRFSGRYGVYHSLYDNFFWMEKFGDPEFVYHALATRLSGLMAMRLAGAEVLPYRFVPYASGLEAQLRELERLSLKRQRLGAVPSEKPGPAPLRPDFAPIAAALARFRAAATALDAALAGLEASGRLPAPGRLSAINGALLRIERAFLDPAGLAGRPWFRHLLFAPGLTTGYAAWPFPGVRQALEENDAAALERESARLLARLSEAVRRLEAAATEIGRDPAD